MTIRVIRVSKISVALKIFRNFAPHFRDWVGDDKHNPKGNQKMKKQTNPNIKAHLIQSAFYLLLLLAVCAIPFALAQSGTRGARQNLPAATVRLSQNTQMPQIIPSSTQAADGWSFDAETESMASATLARR